MAISIQEFRETMETYGATRLDDCKCSYDFLVPCFKVGGVVFVHSGSYYVVQEGLTRVSGDIMNQAMEALGEKYPGGDNFWYGEIHSTKGLLTVVSMIENKYSKEFVEQLTAETYKKLLQCSLIQKNVDILSNELHSSKFEELTNLVKEFDDVVNPYGSKQFKIKEPIQYLDKVRIGIGFRLREENEEHGKISLFTPQIETTYNVDKYGWSYSACHKIKSREGCWIFLGHYYDNGNDSNHVDEVVYLDYTNKGQYEDHPDNIDLRISLKTGMAWTTFKEEQATLATDEQIQNVINHMKMLIEMVRKSIISNIVE